MNVNRSNLNFAEISGEAERRFEDICSDHEGIGNKRHGLIEPRDNAKGDIARTMFYMELAYGLPLNRMRKMLIKWDEKDPVDNEELRRKKPIKKIQKRSNPIIGQMEGGDLKRLEPTKC